MRRLVPFTKQQVKNLAKEYPTPFYIYDEEGIKKTTRNLIEAFSWAPKFKEYFAVKASPNPHIMKMLSDLGCGMDCSSLAELVLSEKAGITGSNIMFSSNDTPAEDFKKARKLNAIINLDDITHIPFLEQNGGIPELLLFRYNPGKSRSGNVIIGNPSEAKYGLTYNQMFETYEIARKKGVRRFGIHTMVISNELHEDYFIETAEMMFSLVNQLYKKLRIEMEFINLGGGLGIPYRPNEKALTLSRIKSGIKNAYKKYFIDNKLAPPAIFIESGRYITGPHGYLVTRAIHEKHTYRDYIGVDANMANLMRPGMYGAYHHVVVMGKESSPPNRVYDVVGSLCENNDKFAIRRKLPGIDIGDYLVICDSGAHGHSMGFNYNGKLRSAEFLLDKKGRFKLIRRAETLEDYMRTIVW